MLITATLIGMLLIAQVASSLLVIWKHPSPSIDHTIFLCGQEGAVKRLEKALQIVESGMLPG